MKVPEPDGPTSSRQSQLGKARIERLIEEATVDAYDETEQRDGLLAMIQDDLALPFETQMLGVTVTVEGIDVDEFEQIVAICRRAGQRQAISILHLPLPEPPPEGAAWIEAYRHWARGR